jgi:hypothetical protein
MKSFNPAAVARVRIGRGEYEFYVSRAADGTPVFVTETSFSAYEMKGDATTADHYQALIAQYGAENVSLPMPPAPLGEQGHNHASVGVGS